MFGAEAAGQQNAPDQLSMVEYTGDAQVCRPDDHFGPFAAAAGITSATESGSFNNLHLYLVRRRSKEMHTAPESDETSGGAYYGACPMMLISSSLHDVQVALAEQRMHLPRALGWGLGARLPGESSGLLPGRAGVSLHRKVQNHQAFNLPP